MTMIKKIFALALCLFAFACSASYDDEIYHTLEQPLVVGCKLEINNVDWIVDSSTTGHTSYSVKNVGNQPCTYKIQSEVTKNGTVISGAVRGPYTLSAGPSVSPTRTDNFSVATNPIGSCRFSIWAKYRKQLALTEQWHNLTPASALDPVPGIVCQ